MTKSEAYDILSKTIRNAAISDVIYEDNPKQSIMIAVLSEIDTVNWTLDEMLKSRRDDAQ